MRAERNAFLSNPGQQTLPPRHPYDCRDQSIGSKRTNNYRPLLSDAANHRSRSISIEMQPHKTDHFQPKIFQHRDQPPANLDPLPADQRQASYAVDFDADRYASNHSHANSSSNSKAQAYPFITKIESKQLPPQPDRLVNESIIAAETRAVWDKQKKELKRIAREKDLIIEELTARNERLTRQLSESKAEIERIKMMTETDKRIFDEESLKSAELLSNNSRVLKETKAKLDAAEADKKAFADKLEQTNQQLEALQTDFQGLNEKLENTAQSEQQAQTDYLQLKEKLKQSEETNERLRKDSNAHFDDLRGLNKSLESELRSLQQHSDRQGNLISSLETEIAKLTDTNTSLNKRLQAMQSSLEKTTVAEEEFSQIQRDNLIKIEDLERKLEDFTSEAESLEKKRTDSEEKLRKAELRLQSTQTQLSTAHALQQQLKNELLLKQKENEELNHFVYRLESELRETAETVSSIEVELQDKVRDIELRERKTSDNSELVRQLAQERDSASEKYHILLEETALFKATAQDIELKNGYLEDTIKRLEAELAQRDQKVGLAHQIGAIERAALGERQVSEKLEQAISTMAVTDGSKKLRLLKASLEEKEKELTQLAGFCKSLQSELLNLRPLSRTNKQLQQQVADLQSENESMAGLLQGLRSELQTQARRGDQQRETEMYARDRLATEKRRVEDLARSHSEEVEKLALQNVTLLMKLSLAFAEIDRLTSRGRTEPPN